MLLLILGTIALGASVFLLSEAVTLRARQREATLKRAASYGVAPVSVRAERPDFRRRAVHPFMSGLARAVLRLTPRATVDSVGAKLLAAGLARTISPTAYLAAKGLLVMAAIPLGILIGRQIATGAPALLFALFTAFIGYSLPDTLVTLRTRARKERLSSQLPDVLDLMAVSVEAGLGFDAALAKLSEEMSGPLVEEFALTLGEMRVGESREKALKRMAERTAVPEIAAFTRAIIQADQLGISLGRILRVQANDTRLRRQAAAEEKAMKAPIKMLFPTVVFIFPAMFIVILGPAFLNLSKFF